MLNGMIVFEMADGGRQYLPCEARLMNSAVRRYSEWVDPEGILRLTPYEPQQIPFKMLPDDVQDKVAEVLEENDLCNVWYEGGEWHTNTKHYTDSRDMDDYYWAGRFKWFYNIGSERGKPESAFLTMFAPGALG